MRPLSLVSCSTISAVLDGIVQHQASVMAFEDVFMVVAVFFILSLPLLLLFDKGRAG